MRTYLLILVAVVLSTMSAFAMSDNDLRVALEQRFNVESVSSPSGVTHLTFIRR